MSQIENYKNCGFANDNDLKVLQLTILRLSEIHMDIYIENPYMCYQDLLKRKCQEVLRMAESSFIRMIENIHSYSMYYKMKLQSVCSRNIAKHSMNLCFGYIVLLINFWLLSKLCLVNYNKLLRLYTKKGEEHENH